MQSVTRRHATCNIHISYLLCIDGSWSACSKKRATENMQDLLIVVVSGELMNVIYIHTIYSLESTCIHISV